MPKFKPGDRVTPVDGGPEMEVVEYLKVTDKNPAPEAEKETPEIHRNNLLCKWFDGKDSHTGTFDEEDLVLVPVK